MGQDCSSLRNLSCSRCVYEMGEDCEDLSEGHPRCMCCSCRSCSGCFRCFGDCIYHSCRLPCLVMMTMKDIALAICAILCIVAVVMLIYGSVQFINSSGVQTTIATAENAKEWFDWANINNP